LAKSASSGLTWGLAALAAALFVPLFALEGIGAFDFWWWMGANAVVLVTASAVLDSGWRQAFLHDLGRGLWWKVLAGVGSAAVLYAVFFAGNHLARALFDFAGSDIGRVYGFKEGAAVVRVGLLIGFLIGPAEELFWRGFLQRRLEARHGPLAGTVVAAVVYAAIHIASLNFMLVAAALVCGLFWGALYSRFRSMTLNVVSHVLWDLAVFLWFPFS